MIRAFIRRLTTPKPRFRPDGTVEGKCVQCGSPVPGREHFCPACDDVYWPMFGWTKDDPAA
jgi:hypothetical protein